MTVVPPHGAHLVRRCAPYLFFTELQNTDATGLKWPERFDLAGC